MADILNTDKEGELKKRLAREKRLREKQLNDLREVLSTPAGKRVWKRLLEEAGAFRSPGAGEQVYTTHVNIGRQDIGFWALKEMEDAKPMAWVEMNREHKADLVRQAQIDKEEEKT